MKLQKPNKTTIAICIMVLGLVVSFFMIGYAYGYKHSVDYANDFVIENCIEYQTFGDNKEYDFSEMFNITLGEQNDTELN